MSLPREYPLEPLPLRLHRAVSLLSASTDPRAPNAQSACGEVAARIVMLEEAVHALLRGDPDALERGRLVLAGG